MHKISKKLAGYLMAGLLTISTATFPVVAGASDYNFSYMGEETGPTGSEMMADLFLMRPFMLASTVVTTVTFIVSLPFAAMGGNVGESAEKLVAEPAAYTFTRPLGEL